MKLCLTQYDLSNLIISWISSTLVGFTTTTTPDHSTRIHLTPAYNRIRGQQESEEVKKWSRQAAGAFPSLFWLNHRNKVCNIGGKREEKKTKKMDDYHWDMRLDVDIK